MFLRVPRSSGHTEAYGEAASPALTIRFGNNRAQSRTESRTLGGRVRVMSHETSTRLIFVPAGGRRRGDLCGG